MIVRGFGLSKTELETGIYIRREIMLYRKSIIWHATVFCVYVYLRMNNDFSGNSGLYEYLC